MRYEVRNAIPGLTVEAILGDAESGRGYLVAASADTLTFQAPGADDPGAAVEIANGERALVYDEAAAIAICVKRTSASDLSGTATILVTAGETAADMLAACDAAIMQTLRALRETDGDTTVERNTLADLRTFRSELMAEVAAEANVTGGQIASFDFSGIMP